MWDKRDKSSNFPRGRDSMPIMDLVQLDFVEPHVGFLPKKLWAYLLFPSADAERGRFLSAALFETTSALAKAVNAGIEIKSSALDLLQRKGDFLAMADAAMRPVISGAVGKTGAVERSAGELSGELLLMAIAHDSQEPGSVSLGNVLRYASDYFKDLKKTRPADLKKVWHAFRPSAHLWAALIQSKELNQSPQKGARRLIPTDGDGLCLFLAFAESLRIKGEAIKHKQAREALLGCVTVS